jgi:FtsZ-binding cell division protein ZapB
MQMRELDRDTIRVAKTTGMSGTATADEINRSLRIGKRKNLRLVACSIPIWSLMLTCLFLSSTATPARGAEEGEREDNDKGIRAEIAALQAQVTSLRSTVSALQGRVSALQTANTSLQKEFNSLQTSNTALQGKLTAVQANNALLLGPFVSLDPNQRVGVRGPNIIFSGANIHIVSGSGTTTDNGNPRGLGNLIIGYDDDPQTLSGGGPGGGPPLLPGDRGGSHNLVIGRGNRFTQTAFGSLVAGDLNAITGISVSVTGGFSNTANGLDSSVSGGAFNIASGSQSSVSGGIRNTASGSGAAVTGGLFNTASGLGTVVIGGQEISDHNDFSIAPQPPFP